MHHHIRANYQNAFKAKFARQYRESNFGWRQRINFAIADINVTLKLHPHDSDYAERLYIELDEARAAYSLAVR